MRGLSEGSNPIMYKLKMLKFNGLIEPLTPYGIDDRHHSPYDIYLVKFTHPPRQAFSPFGPKPRQAWAWNCLIYICVFDLDQILLVNPNQLNSIEPRSLQKA